MNKPHAAAERAVIGMSHFDIAGTADATAASAALGEAVKRLIGENGSLAFTTGAESAWSRMVEELRKVTGEQDTPGQQVMGEVEG